MFQIKLRIWDYMLIGAMFWVICLFISKFAFSLSWGSIFTNTSFVINDLLLASPPKAQTVISVLFIFVCSIVVLATGVIVDALSSIYNLHGTSITRHYLVLNKTWLLNENICKDKSLLSDDITLIIKEHKSLSDEFKMLFKSRKDKKEFQNSQKSMGEKAERINYILVSRIMQSGSSSLAAYTRQLLYHLRIVSVILFSTNLLVLEFFYPFIMSSINTLNDLQLNPSPPNNTVSFLFRNIILPGLFPLAIQISLGWFSVSIYKRSYRKFVGHLFSSYYCIIKGV